MSATAGAAADLHRALLHAAPPREAPARRGQAAIDSGEFSWLHFVPDITKHASSHWSGYVLLTVYVLSQIASTYFMSGTMQKSQRYLMMAPPVVFIPFILRFPSASSSTG